MTHRGGLNLSIIIWRIGGGGGGASFLLPWGPKIILAPYINVRSDGSTASTTFDCHWKWMEGWVGLDRDKTFSLCSVYNYSFANFTKEVVGIHGWWHSSNKLPIMVHGQASIHFQWQSKVVDAVDPSLLTLIYSFKLKGIVSFCHHQDKWLQHCMFVFAAYNNKNNAALPLTYKCLVLF
jgi:hypothetical protein